MNITGLVMNVAELVRCFIVTPQCS